MKATQVSETIFGRERWQNNMLKHTFGPQVFKPAKVIHPVQCFRFLSSQCLLIIIFARPS